MDEMEPLAPEVEEAKQVDEDMYGAMAPKGRFTDRGMNILVQATNKLLPLFGQEPTYPTFKSGEYKILPNDFVRVLSMFTAASKDAADDERVDPELVISLDGVTDDTSLIAMAAKINLLAKSKDFKSFLKEPTPVEEKEESVEEEDKGMKDEDIDALFMSRM